MFESLFNKVTVLQACKFIKKRLQNRFFPVNIAKILEHLFYRTPSVATSACSYEQIHQ